MAEDAAQLAAMMGDGTDDELDYNDDASSQASRPSTPSDDETPLSPSAVVTLTGDVIPLAERPSSDAEEDAPEPTDTPTQAFPLPPPPPPPPPPSVREQEPPKGMMRPPPGSGITTPFLPIPAQFAAPDEATFKRPRRRDSFSSTPGSDMADSDGTVLAGAALTSMLHAASRKVATPPPVPKPDLPHRYSKMAALLHDQKKTGLPLCGLAPTPEQKPISMAKFRETTGKLMRDRCTGYFTEAELADADQGIDAVVSTFLRATHNDAEAAAKFARAFNEYTGAPARRKDELAGKVPVPVFAANSSKTSPRGWMMYINDPKPPLHDKQPPRDSLLLEHLTRVTLMGREFMVIMCKVQFTPESPKGKGKHKRPYSHLVGQMLPPRVAAHHVDSYIKRCRKRALEGGDDAPPKPVPTKRHWVHATPEELAAMDVDELATAGYSVKPRATSMPRDGPRGAWRYPYDAWIFKKRALEANNSSKRKTTDTPTPAAQPRPKRRCTQTVNLTLNVIIEDGRLVDVTLAGTHIPP